MYTTDGPIPSTIAQRRKAPLNESTTAGHAATSQSIVTRILHIREPPEYSESQRYVAQVP
jgi:hypothetical protein